MSSPEGQSFTGRPTPQRPLWEIGLAALLLALGVEPKRQEGYSPQRVGAQHGKPASPSRLDAASDRPHFEPELTALRRDHSIKNILLSLYHRISEHRVVSIAGGVTFFALLAIFPTLAALVSIYGLFTDPATIGSHLDRLSGFLPGGAMEVI